MAARIFSNTCAWLPAEGVIRILPDDIRGITRMGVGVMAIKVNDGANNLVIRSKFCTSVPDGASRNTDPDIIGTMILR